MVITRQLGDEFIARLDSDNKFIGDSFLLQKGKKRNISTNGINTYCLRLKVLICKKKKIIWLPRCNTVGVFFFFYSFNINLH